MQEITTLPKLPVRSAEGHKGDFGRICIVAGSIGFSGAAAISAKSALRSGAGLVRAAIPKSVLPVVASIEPCFTTIPLAEDTSGRISVKARSAVLRVAGENDVVAFGPGVGVSQGIGKVLESLLRIDGLRLLIDADGLNNLAKLSGWPVFSKSRLILTPHPGERKRVWNSLLREPMPAERVDQAAKLSLKSKAVVVLKGHKTVVCDGERFYVNPTGNPGMATAGAGDVLTGIIAALAGQGLDDFDASVLGVYLHGLSGDLAAKKIGQMSLIATDIIDFLCDAFVSVSNS